MRMTPFARLVVALALAVGLPPAAAQAGGPKVRIDPYYAPSYGGLPGYSRPAVPRRPVIACDAYGRCWRPGSAYGSYGAYGYSPYGYGFDRRTARPPGWAYDAPRGQRHPDRFVRPRDGVVCDRASLVCYKRGAIDKSETRSAFGDRAADRADDVRDRFGTGRLFVPERGVACDPQRRACFDDGFADYSLTRRYFGDKAAKGLD